MVLVEARRRAEMGIAGWWFQLVLQHNVGYISISAPVDDHSSGVGTLITKAADRMREPKVVLVLAKNKFGLDQNTLW